MTSETESPEQVTPNIHAMERFVILSPFSTLHIELDIVDGYREF